MEVVKTKIQFELRLEYFIGFIAVLLMAMFFGLISITAAPNKEEPAFYISLVMSVIDIALLIMAFTQCAHISKIIEDVEDKI